LNTHKQDKKKREKGEEGYNNLKSKLQEEKPYLFLNGNHILQYSSSTSISFPLLLA
jgi:hypothetical protein